MKVEVVIENGIKRGKRSKEKEVIKKVKRRKQEIVRKKR